MNPTYAYRNPAMAVTTTKRPTTEADEVAFKKLKGESQTMEFVGKKRVNRLKATRMLRWGSERHKINMPGMPTILPSGFTMEQLDAYVLILQIEDLNRRIRSGEYIPSTDRSPSPEPEYGAGGLRTNTKEARYRWKLEDEKQHLIEQGTGRIPGFRPPSDYTRPMKQAEKLYLPCKDFPEINFIGLLIGPRGHTLKKMENESGAKISIRGKGSLKEGKNRENQEGDDEDLHCLVMGDTEEKIQKCIDLINQIIETATSIPEGHNELKRIQLRELAALNGTLKDDEIETCPNCGDIGHKKYECPAAKNLTISLICKICGGAGHIMKDCKFKNDPAVLEAAKKRDAAMDNEYNTLMETLSGGKKQIVQPTPSAITAPWAKVDLSAYSALPPPPGMDTMMPPGMGGDSSYNSYGAPPSFGPPGSVQPSYQGYQTSYESYDQEEFPPGAYSELPPGY